MGKRRRRWELGWEVDKERQTMGGKIRARGEGTKPREDLNIRIPRGKSNMVGLKARAAGGYTLCHIFI